MTNRTSTYHLLDGKLVEAEAGATYDNVNPADDSIMRCGRCVTGRRRAGDRRCAKSVQ